MNTNESMALRISHIEKSTELLGPFCRFVIWVHGCCFSCKGCLAENTKHGTPTYIDINELSEEIVASGCEGITISGGEPFLQADKLSVLIEKIKSIRDIGVIIYSGFTLEEIQKDPNKAMLLPYVDLLIDGQYIEELDVGQPYIGSTNQIIHYLSSRYLGAGRLYYAAKSRKAEIKITSKQAILIGVPSKKVLAVWNELKKKSGGTGNDL